MSKRRRSTSPTRDKIPEPKRRQSTQVSIGNSTPTHSQICFPPIDEEESCLPQQVSSHWGKTLKDHIIQAGRKAPRFLFGVFTIDDLNHSATVVNGVITPQFFIGAECTPPIFKMSLQDVKDHNMWNFEGEWPTSVRHALWSTWDPSLRSTVERAIEMSKDQCVSVAVLDTKRLGPNNVVLRETDMPLVEHEESKPFPGDGWCFIFGPILPDAFSMIPLAALATPVPHEELLNKLRQSNSGPTLALTDIFDTAEKPLINDFDDELIMAKKLGRLFGDHFALPVACMATGCLARHPDLQIIWLEQDSHLRSLTVSNFKDFAVPISWLKDLSVTREKASLLAVPDARRGMRLLRDIVKCRRQPRQTKKAVADLTSMLTRFNLGLQFVVLEGASCESSTFCTPGPSQPESEESEEEIDDVEDDLLKGSPIDDSMPLLQRQLLKAQSYTPRYLFRAWNDTDRISGGHPGLNTTTAITPRAFLHRSASAKSSIYDIPKSELRRMCITHLRTGKDPHFMTQFSSWAASIQVAFRFARGSPDNCYISIIDTKELRDSNAIMHVPSLEFLIGARNYEWEYLAHGIMLAFKDAGIPTVAYGFTIPMRLHSAHDLDRWRASEQSARITTAELEGAKRVASLYGEKFGTPVLLAILTLKQRDRDFWRSRDELETALPLFVEATKDFVVPAELCADASILTDIVYTTEYENVEQMIRMLRALVNWQHGKGARGRKMVAPWKEVRVKEEDMDSSTVARMTPREQRRHERELDEAREIRRAQEAAHPPRALNVDAAAVQQRDEIAAALLSFYEFLTTLHIPASALRRPPPEGWPSITAEHLAFLNKTDVVIDILKHIPYITDDDMLDNGYQIYEKCICIDYTGKRFERHAVDYQRRDAVDPVDFMGDDCPWPNVKDPEHIITLARSEKGDAGFHLFLDTKDGSTALVELYDHRCTADKPMRERVEGLISGFRNLDLIPTAPDDVQFRSGTWMNEEQFKEIRVTYERFGWQSEGYRQDECMKAMKEVMHGFLGLPRQDGSP